MRTIGGIKIPEKDTYRVDSTFDYGKFKFIEGNRDVDHEKKLEESMRECGLLLQPILVNELYEIVEGQNRYTACMNLGLPIYYIVQPGIRLKEVKSLNSASKNWNTKNFIHSYALGDQNLNYIYVEQLMKAYPWANQSLITFALTGVSGWGSGINTYKSGDFKCTEAEYNKAVKVLDYVGQFEELLAGTKGKKYMYLLSLAFCYMCPSVDNDYLVTKMEKYGRLLGSAASITDAMSQIEGRVYNYQMRSPREPISIVNEYERYKRMNRGRKKAK